MFCAMFLALILTVLGQLLCVDDHTLGPDKSNLGPKGEVIFGTSQIFPGTVRDYWVMCPAVRSCKTRVHHGFSGRSGLYQDRR
jgi:hypothetical protein